MFLKCPPPPFPCVSIWHGRALTLHVLRHDPVVQQAVVVGRALDRLYQQVVGGGAGGVRLALGLRTVGQAGQQEEEVVHVPQEVLALARELERGLVLEDAGRQPQQTSQAVILDAAVLLVQHLAAAPQAKPDVHSLASTVFHKIWWGFFTMANFRRDHFSQRGLMFRGAPNHDFNHSLIRQYLNESSNQFNYKKIQQFYVHSILE